MTDEEVGDDGVIVGWVSHQVHGRQPRRYHAWSHYHGASAIRIGLGSSKGKVTNIMCLII
jgi:hypothetical protein